MSLNSKIFCPLFPLFPPPFPSTRQAVLDYPPKIEKLSDRAKDLTLNKVAKLNFHNRIILDFTKIKADILKLEEETLEFEKQVLL